MAISWHLDSREMKHVAFFRLSLLVFPIKQHSNSSCFKTSEPGMCKMRSMFFWISKPLTVSRKPFHASYLFLKSLLFWSSGIVRIWWPIARVCKQSELFLCQAPHSYVAISHWKVENQGRPKLTFTRMLPESGVQQWSKLWYGMFPTKGIHSFL